MLPTPHERCNDVSNDLVAAIPGVEMRKPSATQARTVEIDLWTESQSIADITNFLSVRGFVPMRSLREGSHRFFVAHRPGGWCKIDAKTREGGRRRPSNIWWALRRRRGAILAVVGADGAGKTSTIETIHDTAPFGLEVAYLGRRRKTSPSGEITSSGPAPSPRSPAHQAVGVGVWTLRTARRLFPIHVQARLGRVVVCDRHPIEIQAVDGATSPLARTLRGFVANHILPGPDHIVLLAAPGEVLYARKGEHNPERLDAMTAAFRELVQRHGGTEIDASATHAEVVSAVEEVILDTAAERLGVVASDG